jgi:hypothetical protein
MGGCKESLHAFHIVFEIEFNNKQRICFRRLGAGDGVVE